jgi:hypothetical protein
MRRDPSTNIGCKQPTLPRDGICVSNLQSKMPKRTGYMGMVAHEAQSSHIAYSVSSFMVLTMTVVYGTEIALYFQSGRKLTSTPFSRSNLAISTWQLK